MIKDINSLINYSEQIKSFIENKDIINYMFEKKQVLPELSSIEIKKSKNKKGLKPN